MAAALGLELDRATRRRAAPHAHPAARAENRERKTERLGRRLGPAVAEEDAGLEGRGIAGIGRGVTDLEPSHRVYPLLPEAIEGSRQPPRLSSDRDAVGIRRRRVPRDFRRPESFRARRSHRAASNTRTDDPDELAVVRYGDVIRVERARVRRPDAVGVVIEHVKPGLRPAYPVQVPVEAQYVAEESRRHDAAAARLRIPEWAGSGTHDNRVGLRRL